MQLWKNRTNFACNVKRFWLLGFAGESNSAHETIYVTPALSKSKRKATAAHISLHCTREHMAQAVIKPASKMRMAPWRDGLIESMLFETGCVRFVVSGQCMQPTFSDGDILEATKGTFCIGDIVLFRSETRLKTHRLIRVEGDVAYTKSERGSFDAPISVEAILGVVRVVQPERPKLLVRFRRLFWRLSLRRRHPKWLR